MKKTIDNIIDLLKEAKSIALEEHDGKDLSLLLANINTAILSAEYSSRQNNNRDEHNLFSSNHIRPEVKRSIELYGKIRSYLRDGKKVFYDVRAKIEEEPYVEIIQLQSHGSGWSFLLKDRKNWHWVSEEAGSNGMTFYFDSVPSSVNI